MSCLVPRIGLLAICATLVVTTAACGGDSGNPTSPSAPRIPDVSGIWRGTSTLTSATGGECIGNAFRQAIGLVVSQSMTVTQTGSRLTVVATTPQTGTSSTLTGAVDSNGRIELVWESSTLETGLFQCPNGAVRRVTTFAGTASLDVSGNRVTGTSANSSNVTTRSGAPISILTTRSRENFSR